MPFPFETTFTIPELFTGHPQTLTIRNGLTTLVGPNGSGKTQVMHALRAKLASVVAPKHVRYVSPGRLALLESHRSDLFGNAHGLPSYAGNMHIAPRYLAQTRHNASGLTGDLLAMYARPDIRMKVEARMGALFGRFFDLRWEQQGLQLLFSRNDAGSEYEGPREASGLVHLVALLAAAYDDEIGALLVDEPEVSLHPQLQAYVARVFREVAGDPTTLGKKLVVVSTHSPAMLRVQRPEDLSNLVFFDCCDRASHDSTRRASAESERD